MNGSVHVIKTDSHHFAKRKNFATRETEMLTSQKSPMMCGAGDVTWTRLSRLKLVHFIKLN